MKKCFFFTLAVGLLPFLSNSNLYSAEPTADTKPDAEATGTNAPNPAVVKDVDALVTRINAKIQQDKTSEADYADNIKEFDALLEKYKDAKPGDRVGILLKKGTLYLQVLRLPEKALPVFEKIKSDYPGIQVNGSTDDLIAGVKDMVEKKKIRDALAPGAPFPDFNESDVEGHELSISKYKGKVVLLDFWATWCGPCVAKIPEITKAYDKYHDKGLEVVGISLDVDKDRLQQFTKQRKMPWPEFFDGKRWENKLAIKYGVESTPTTYLIDRDGKVIKVLDLDADLDQEIASALKK